MKVLFVNPTLMARSKGVGAEQERLNYMRQFILTPCYGIIDRTQNLILQGDPLIFGTTNKTLAQLIDERSNQIVTRAVTDGLPITVFWSGGPASSAVLLSFMKKVTTDNLRIVTTHNAIVLNPEVAASIKDGNWNVDYRIGRGFELAFNESNSIKVTGIGAHNFNIPTHTPADIDGSVGDQPWASYLPDQFLTEGLQKILHVFPVDVQTTRQMYWALGVSLVYNTWKYVTTFNIQGGKEIQDTTEHFFLTQEFQDYGCSHYDDIDKPRMQSLIQHIKDSDSLDLTNIKMRAEFVYGLRNRSLFMYDDYSYQTLEDFNANGFRN